MTSLTVTLRKMYHEPICKGGANKIVAGPDQQFMLEERFVYAISHKSSRIKATLCKIRFTEGRWIIMEHCSEFNLYVDGKRVRRGTIAELKPDDIIESVVDDDGKLVMHVFELDYETETMDVMAVNLFDTTEYMLNSKRFSEGCRICNIIFSKPTKYWEHLHMHAEG